MNNIKRNFIYNGVLTLSQYILPLITFSYVSRVLGVENIGLVGFVDSIVNYFILFSTLGIGILGVREVARNINNSKKLNEVFSSLLIIHFIFTLFFLCIYITSIACIPELSKHKELYYVGIGKIVANIFLTEWFFRGLEKFKYITISNIIIRIIYVISIFILIKQPSDYITYFILNSCTYVVNAIINYVYSKKYVQFCFNVKTQVKNLLIPFASLGIYIVLTSMYTTFNVTYLGFTTDITAVGYYSTALKIYTIVLGIFTALNTVMIPRMSILFVNQEVEKFKILIKKSFIFVFSLGIPIVFFIVILAPELINLFTGKGYEGAIPILQIIIPLIVIVGMAQILVNQILIIYKKEKQLVLVSICGVVVGVILNISLVSSMKEIGTALVLIFSETIVTSLLTYYVYKTTKIEVPFFDLLKCLLISLPYLAICLCCKNLFSHDFVVLVIATFFSVIYFIISQYYIFKEKQIIKIVQECKAIICISLFNRKLNS